MASSTSVSPSSTKDDQSDNKQRKEKDNKALGKQKWLLYYSIDELTNSQEVLLGAFQYLGLVGKV